MPRDDGSGGKITDSDAFCGFQKMLKQWSFSFSAPLRLCVFAFLSYSLTGTIGNSSENTLIFRQCQFNAKAQRRRDAKARGRPLATTEDIETSKIAGLRDNGAAGGQGCEVTGRIADV